MEKTEKEVDWSLESVCTHRRIFINMYPNNKKRSRCLNDVTVARCRLVRLDGSTLESRWWMLWYCRDVMSSVMSVALSFLDAL